MSCIPRTPEYVGVPTLWQSRCARDKYSFGLAMTLVFRCFQLKNSGVFSAARELLSSEIERGLLGLTRDDASYLTTHECELWHWEGDDLHVDLYSRELENKIIKTAQARKKLSRMGVIARRKKQRKEAQTTLSDSADTQSVPKDPQPYGQPIKEYNSLYKELLSNSESLPESTSLTVDKNSREEAAAAVKAIAKCLCDDEEVRAVCDDLFKPLSEEGGKSYGC